MSGTWQNLRAITANAVPVTLGGTFELADPRLLQLHEWHTDLERGERFTGAARRDDQKAARYRLAKGLG